MLWGVIWRLEGGILVQGNLEDGYDEDVEGFWVLGVCSNQMGRLPSGLDISRKAGLVGYAAVRRTRFFPKIAPV